VKFLITYDIADDGRRNRLVRLLNEYGRRVQYSCFEVSLNPESLSLLKGKIEEVIIPEEDSVFIFPITEFALPFAVKLGVVEPSVGDSEVL
jgi:CRISPR-associated protein Cas2